MKDALKQKKSKVHEVKKLETQVKFGIRKMNGFLDYMVRFLRYMEENGQEVDEKQQDAHDKCQELLRTLRRKEEKAENIKRNQSLNIRDMQIELMSTSNLNKTEGAQREEQSLVDKKLKEWANELDFIVG